MRQKRYDRLLFAYKKSGTPLPLVIVGGGELDQIKIQIDKLDLKNKVIFIGANSNPYKFMKHATALLLSSDYEGLPTVIIEAFICGIPVISTDCPSGPSELLLKDQKRFLVPLDDIDAFAEAINSIIKTPPKIPLALLDKFHPSNVANQYIMLCKER
jgi:glycosyltransferase involved in cell wall biosynthesis